MYDLRNVLTDDHSKFYFLFRLHNLVFFDRRNAARMVFCGTGKIFGSEKSTKSNEKRFGCSNSNRDLNSIEV